MENSGQEKDADHTELELVAAPGVSYTVTMPDASIRNAALEEAAKVCDRIAGEHGQYEGQAAYDCGDAIRALKT